VAARGGLRELKPPEMEENENFLEEIIKKVNFFTYKRKKEATPLVAAQKLLLSS